MNNFRLLLWLFYKPLLVLNLIFTGCALFVLLKNGLVTLPLLLVLKVLGYVASVGYQYFSTPYSYYFYRNAGYPVRKLYAYVFMADFLLFLLLIISLISLYAGFKG